MKKILFISVLLSLTLTNTLLADGCLPGEPCWDPPRRAPEVVYESEPEVIYETPQPTYVPEPQAPVEVEPVPMMKKSSWNLGLEPGVAAFMHRCWGTEVAPSLMFNIGREDSPWNVRTGAQWYDLSDTALNIGFETDIIRIPLLLEYGMEVSNTAKLMLGGGINGILVDGFAGQSDDEFIGGSLGVRYVQSLMDNIDLSVAGEYLFAESDIKTGDGEDLLLDGPVITTGLSFNF